MKARLPEGFGGGIPNMQNMLKKAQKMQEEMQKAQAELEERTFEASAGGGVVTVTVNGKKQIVSITLKPEVVDPDDIEMLQDLVTAAVNEALGKVDEATQSEMSKFTSGLGLPGGIPGLF
jgi:DNA-binding YbaB/EbfC family protein